MPRAGDEIFNPATRLRTVFREIAQTTGGELLQVDWIAGPGWTTGPDHMHPRQEERFEVLRGRLGVRLEGTEGIYRPGEAVTVAPAEKHAAWNAGDGEVHVLVELRPALRTEYAFETLAALGQAGRITAVGIPRNPLRLAQILKHYDDELRLARPPPALQRAILGPLATLARAAGYRPEHAYDYGRAVEQP